MKWVVACDLLPDAEGALEWIAWLQHGGAAELADVAAVRVVEELVMLPLPAGDRGRVEAAAREDLAAALQRRARYLRVAEAKVVLHPSIDQALADEARSRKAALVIGRRARRGEDRWVRLGRTARRLLREMPGPVVVVPPDLREKDFGPGPIVVAISLRDDQLAAVRFAEALGRRMRRPLVLANVQESPPDLIGFLSPARAEELRTEHRAGMQAALAAFVAKHALGNHDNASLVGPPAAALIELAERAHAAMLVCGSRLLGTVERLVSASMGRELAATATLPVAVVPSDLSPQWLA